MRGSRQQTHLLWTGAVLDAEASGRKIIENAHGVLSVPGRGLGVFSFSFVCVCVFCIFRAALAAYGGSQARGRIGAIATNLHHSSQQCWILNPLSKARDRTLNLMVSSWIH